MIKSEDITVLIDNEMVGGIVSLVILCTANAPVLRAVVTYMDGVDEIYYLSRWEESTVYLNRREDDKTLSL